MFLIHIKALGIKKPETEYKFHPKRKWRLDYAWPDSKLAVEIEGGIWIRGRHNRALGFLKDKEKYNALAHMRWHLLRFTPQEEKNGQAAQSVRAWFESRG